MKKLLLSITMVLLLVSCSDDNETSPNAKKIVLKQTKSSFYTDEILTNTNITDYKNGRIEKISKYNSQNVLRSYVQYNYNLGMISTIKIYMPNGQMDESQTFRYDSQNRLISIYSQRGSDNFTLNFIHNNDNTIIVPSLIEGLPPSIFYLNSNGMVYRHESSSGSTYEVNYDGFNPVSAIFNEVAHVSYTYDSDHDTSLMNLENLTGDFKPNYILMHLSLSGFEYSFSTKYVTRQGTERDFTDYVYVFNERGVPVKRSTFSSEGKLRNQLEYIYEE